MTTEDGSDERDGQAREGLVARPALDRLGIAELEEYITGLRREIVRAEGEMARKAGHRSLADGLFGKG